MVRTEAGYGGGLSPRPSYHDLEEHAEIVRVEFDPQVVSLEELLDLFWSHHDPFHGSGRGQYRALLLGETPNSAERLHAAVAALEERVSRRVVTEVFEGPFHRAEDYHQKWRLRRRERVFQELSRSYSDERSLLDSVAATKLNGYVGGHGTRAQLERDVGRLGLSSAAQVELLETSRAA